MSEMLKSRLEQYPEISFIEGKSFEGFLANLLEIYQKKYKELTGEETEFSASDPVRLVLYSCSVLLYQGLQHVDRAGKMGLLKYSTGEFLDNLAALRSVSRESAKAAVAKERFYLSVVLGNSISIPKGTRVKGGELFFATTEAVEISAGQLYADASISCLTLGKDGNDFLPGEINVLVDPIPYIVMVENIEKSVGGADKESDEALAERIYLSSSAHSTAGPEAAYRYWVLSYDTTIQDCRIRSESPGEVDIYILLQDGKLPESSFLEDLEAFLSSDEKRPLTDKVIVKAPEKKEYAIDATYYISKSDCEMEETIQQQTEAAVQSYISWQQAAIARDINPSRLMYELIRAGVKWAEIRSPVFTELTGASVAVPASVNLIYGGLQDD